MKIKFRIKSGLIATLCLFGSITSASAALIVNSPVAITQVVNIQSIIVSDDDGTNTAGFLGNTGQQSIIEGFIDDIWAQAGIDINFLSTNYWNDSFANSGTVDPRPTSDINTITESGVLAGVASPDANVINMYFVNIAAGFSLLSDNSAAGLAYVNSNGITQYVGSNLLSFTGGQETVASVISHEIGHNLGLDHIIEIENLLDSGSTGQRLNATQVSTALGSNFSIDVTPVPVPPALVLFLSGLGFLGFYKRKRV